MKAKDINKLCPMTEDEKVKCVYTPSLRKYGSPWAIFEKTRRLSAEISFNLGIKEVAGTFKRENPTSYKKYEAWWQAKLKEWECNE